MTPRTLLFAGMLALVALAGCSSQGSDEPGSSASPTGSGTSGVRVSGTAPSGGASPTPGQSSPSPSAIPSGGPAPTEANTPPAAAVGADVKAANLTVMFTLSATDANGDALSWVFDANSDNTTDAQGNDTVLPKKLNFTFAAAGTYTAKLKVTDGRNTTVAVQNVTVSSGTTTVGPPTEYTCTVDAPTPAQVNIDAQGFGGKNVGHCTFVTTTVTTKLVSAAPASGCTIEHAGAATTVGAFYEPGKFDMECFAPSTGGVGKISLAS